jgi:starch synthase
MKVLSVASEVFPLVKTGGLADVAGALPAALAREGVEVRTLLPGYPAVLRDLDGAEIVHAEEDLHGGPARVLAGQAAGLALFVLEAPHLFGRPGSPYLGPDGRDWSDNAKRFAALSQVAAALGQGALGRWIPDVVHAHDWQAGLVPAYLHFSGQPRPQTVMTVHNMAFQGRFPAHLLQSLGLPPRAFAIDGVEYYGGIGYLKAGLQLADRISTVSPTYALEIQTSEGGMGLDGLLRARSHDLFGILNGIDEAVWDPARDPSLAAPYDVGSVERRAVNKDALQARLGLARDGSALLYGVVSRLSAQKGLDLLLGALPALLAQGAQLALLGAGERELEDGFRKAASAHPSQVAAVFGFDEALAHQIQGGCDALLVPSRFEPCGLTQLCALRYGAVPVVARVGGLADTIIDANEMAVGAGVATGVQFAPVSQLMLEAALARTAALWRDKVTWSALQRNGMTSDVGWGRPAKHYAALYRGRAAGAPDPRQAVLSS